MSLPRPPPPPPGLPPPPRPPLPGPPPVGRAASVGKPLLRPLPNKFAKDRVNHELYNAVKGGHVKEVLLLLDRGGDVNYCKIRDPLRTWTNLLYKAVRNGYEEIVKILVNRNALLNTMSLVNTIPTSPLHSAAINGHMAIVKILKENGADLTLKLCGKTALDLARLHRHQEMIDLLTLTDIKFFTEAKMGNLQTVEYALKCGADVNDRNDTDGKTMLHMAAERDHQSLVKLLVKKWKADFTLKDKFGWTPLHWAVYNGHKGTVKLLLEEGAIIMNSSDSHDDSINVFDVARQSTHKNILPILRRCQDDRDKDLLKAASSCDISPLQEALSFGANVNAHNLESETALHFAVMGGFDGSVRVLLDYCADLNKKNEDGFTAFHCSVLKGFTELMLLLLDRGADIDAVTNEEKTALHLAVEHGHHDIIKLLIEKGINVDTKDNSGKTALYIALQNGNQDIVKLFIDCDCNADDTEFLSVALVYAVEKGSLDDVERLLDIGAPVNSKDQFEKTSLHYAAENGYFKIAEILVKTLADVNSRDKEQKIPLHYAAQYKHCDVVKLLVENQSDLEAQDMTGRTPLNWSYVNDCFEAYEALQGAGGNFNFSMLLIDSVMKDDEVKFMEALENDATDVNRADINMKTALHYAAEKGQESRVRLLIGKGVCPNCEDKAQWTPLHYAAVGGHHNVVEFLIQLTEVAVNSQTEDGKTALHYAAINNHSAIVQTIMDHHTAGDINRNITDKSLKTPLHYAAEKGYFNVVQILTREEFDVNVPDIQKFTPFHCAVSSGRHDVIMLLIDKGANIHEKTVLDKNALHLVSEKGHYSVVKLLIEKKVDINCVDKHGRSPLHYAASNGHYSVLKLLIEEGANYLLQDAADATPSYYAARGHGNHMDIFRHLISLEYHDEVIRTSIHTAVEMGSFDEVLKLCGSSPNRRNQFQQTALHCAAMRGHKKIMKHLLDLALHCDDKDVYGRTALHYAAEIGDCEIVQLLVDHGALLSIEDKKNATLTRFQALLCRLTQQTLPNTRRATQMPLNLSYKNGHHKVTEILEKHGGKYNYTWLLADSAEIGDIDRFKLSLQSGADVTAKFTNESTVLHIAAAKGSVEMVDLLVNGHNVDVNSGDWKKKTALHYAAENNCVKVFQFLVDNGANINHKDVCRKTVLHSAAVSGNERFFEICSGVDIDSKDSDGCTAIQIAVQNSHDRLVMYLLDKGASVSGKDNYGRTLLHLAVMGNHNDVIKVLLDKNIDHSCTDKNDETASHYAAENGRVDILQTLLDYNVDIFSSNRKGICPIFYAAKNGHRNAVEFLLENGANMDSVKPSKDELLQIVLSPLHGAALGGAYDVAVFLIERGANLHCIEGNTTPMHLAAKNGHSNIVQLLFVKGADPDSKDQAGYTPLHYACEGRHVSVVEYLLQTGKVDPMAKNNLNLVPIEMLSTRMPRTYNQEQDTDENRIALYSLFQPFEACRQKLPIESYGKVFICGYSTAGKSSLSQVIVVRSKNPPGHLYNHEEIVSGVTQFTAGIEPHTISSPELGTIVLYDFAGHTEYYSSHAAILENLMLHSPAIFIVIVNLEDDDDAKAKQVLYWFNFIENIGAKLTKQSQVIVIGSRADIVSDNTEQLCEFFEKVAKKGITRQCYKGFVAVDCHRLAGVGISSFMSLLADTCKEVIGQSDSVSFYCYVLGLFLQELDKVAISVDKLCKLLRDCNQPSLPSEVSAVCEFLSILSDRGMIVYIRHSTSYGWVIIDKDALLSSIVGVLFAPKSIARVYQGIASNTGIVHVGALKRVFPQYDPEMVKGFLLSLEFCQVVDAKVLNSMKTNVLPMSKVKSGELLFFPSLIAAKSPAEMNSAPKFGWCLWCPDPQKFLSSRYLHVLLLHLALNYPLNVEVPVGELSLDINSGERRQSAIAAAQQYQRHCKVWLNGIHWRCNDLEVLVELSEYNRCVTLLVSDVNECESQKTCSSIINEILSLKNQLCPCETSEYIVAPDQLADVRTKPVADRVLVRVDDIATALILQREDVLDTQQKKVSVDKMISQHEPYYCLSPVFTQKLFAVDANKSSLSKSECCYLSATCPDIMKQLPGNWKESSTYQSVRDHLTKFSIFTEDPLELAKSRLQKIVARSDFMSQTAEKELERLSSLLKQPLKAAVEESKPKKHHLVELLSQISYQWNLLGVLLGVPDKVLHGLRKSNEEDDTKLSEVLQKWLDMKTPAKPVNWQSIISLLMGETDLRNGSLALKIQMFLGIGAENSDETEEKSCVQLAAASHTTSSDPVATRPAIGETTGENIGAAIGETTGLATGGDAAIGENIRLATGDTIEPAIGETTGPAVAGETTGPAIGETTGPVVAGETTGPAIGETTGPAVAGETTDEDATRETVAAATAMDYTGSTVASSGETAKVPIGTGPVTGVTTGAVTGPTTGPVTGATTDHSVTLGSLAPTAAGLDGPTVSIHITINELRSDPRHYTFSYPSPDSESLLPHDKELRGCCQYLDKLPDLAGFLGVSDECYQRVVTQYKDKKMQGYWILKNWKNRNPHGTRLELVEILEDLGLTRAAESFAQ